MKKLMTIDPGANGGIAYHALSGCVKTCKMPDGMTEQANELRSIIIDNKITTCYIEKVGSYMPGNSATAAVKFARHCGHLEAILYMLSVRTMQVTPNVWMRGVFGDTLPKDKTQRKNAVKEEMARRFPYLKVTLSTSDALGILEYAEKTEGVTCTR